MRLTKHDEQVATAELLERLRLSPQELTTTGLIGSPRFHGVRTLSRRQVARLLRASDAVKHRYVGSGCRWASRWTLKVPV